MAYTTVPEGIFRGWNLDELKARQDLLKSFLLNRPIASGQMVSASENGKAFTYSPIGGLTFEQEQAELQNALSYLDPTVQPLPTSTVFAAGPVCSWRPPCG